MTDTELLVRGLGFAARKHRMQRRKDMDASPYINHPIDLLSVLCVECGVKDPIILTAAVLHDTIEDTDTTISELITEFGPQIAGVVVELTDDKALPKVERKRLQIEHAPLKSDKATFVKLADKICNLRDMAASPPASWSIVRRQEYFDWARSVVDGLPLVDPKLLALFDEAFARKPR